MPATPDPIRVAREPDVPRSVAVGVLVWGTPLLTLGILVHRVFATWAYLQIFAAIIVTFGVLVVLRWRRGAIDFDTGFVEDRGFARRLPDMRSVWCRYDGATSAWHVELSTTLDVPASSPATDAPPPSDDPEHRQPVWDTTTAAPVSMCVVSTRRIARAWQDAIRIARALDLPLRWIGGDGVVAFETDDLERSRLWRDAGEAEVEGLPDETLAEVGVHAAAEGMALRLRWTTKSPPLRPVFLSIWLLVGAFANAYLFWLADGYHDMWWSAGLGVLGLAGLVRAQHLQRVAIELDPTSLRVAHGRRREHALANVQVIAPGSATGDHLVIAFREGAIELPTPREAAGPLAARLRFAVRRVGQALANTETRRA